MFIDDGPNIDFARRSVRYLVEHNYRADEIVRALTDELALSTAMAHALVSEATELVAA